MKKILVANRGEIALRIIRSARHAGIRTVAVFSEPDRQLPFMRYADEAVNIGPAEAAQSYLNIERILQAAKETGADAIHPGYGFLSENADFAEAVEKAGITFIGPPAAAIKVMGDKLKAKEAVKAYNIPLLPGTDEPVTDMNVALKSAKDIGFPVLIKAAAGGGGKGMRVVEKEEDFENQMKRAKSEAAASFGNDAVFIEKYISSPKHIEVQVLADKHGNYIHIFERECSIQRRHQKVVEEAPSPVVDDKLRAQLGESAVNVARSCDYVGAGTVEFLMDEKKNFYFLEMNTRLQVEHPVTEMVSGVDLVNEQINIARGEKLTLNPDNLTLKGHAIELRVYAEDPGNGFLPSTGKLTRYRPPLGGGVRVDDGYDEGMEVKMYYDPMIAKLVAYGEDRKTAIGRLLQAIDEYEIEGVRTTLPFGSFVLKHPVFIDGTFDTHFVDKYFTADKLYSHDEQEAEAAAILAVKLVEDQNIRHKASVQTSTKSSKWKKNRK